jgi:hemolysin III
MTTDTLLPEYSKGEEIANSITHGIGILLAISGLGVLTAFASIYGDVWHVVACSIYSSTMILLYTASTLYHSIQTPRAKRVLRVFDHSAIYLLIAGTYTPFTLINLRGPWGWALFGTAWGLAILGIVLEVTVARRWKMAGIALYLAMGWAIVVVFRPLMASMDTGGLVLIGLGGLAYTLGVAFYAWKRLPYNHAIWHGFVLTGSILHFFAILFYVIPLA